MNASKKLTITAAVMTLVAIGFAYASYEMTLANRVSHSELRAVGIVVAALGGWFLFGAGAGVIIGTMRAIEPNDHGFAIRKDRWLGKFAADNLKCGATLCEVGGQFALVGAFGAAIVFIAILMLVVFALGASHPRDGLAALALIVGVAVGCILIGKTIGGVIQLIGNGWDALVARCTTRATNR